MLCGVAALLPVLIAQSSRDTEKPNASPAPVRWLNVEQVVAQFGVSKRWLYTHKHLLPYSQPSHKVLLFDADKLTKWFQAHKGGG